MKILVAPLDWGLGHASRCIPIIRYLREKNCEVILAGNGRSLGLLRKEFPDLAFIHLPGYDITYPDNGSMVLKMFLQLPGIRKAIRREHRQLQQIIDQKKIDAVISDNRYGLWSKKIPCVFITHQLWIKSPVFQNLIRKINLYFVSRFTECWIPDVKSHPMHPGGLSGELSHGKPMPSNAHYIGILSRFDQKEEVRSETKERKILILLSGPEPQRTILEEKILDELIYPDPELTEYKFLLVRGVVEHSGESEITSNLRVVNHLVSERVEEEMRKAEIIICRPGYSTIMDLASINKSAVFVPTPGQTEQEYLGGYMADLGFGICVGQQQFSISKILASDTKREDAKGWSDLNNFESIVDRLLSRVQI